MKRLPIVEVEWEDAAGHEGTWRKLGDVVQWAKQRDGPDLAVGYLLARNEKFLTLAMLASSDCYGNNFRIPAGCVRRIRRLKR